MASLSFKSLDFFRRVKRELVPEITEVSWIGTLMSCFAFAVMCFLVYVELTHFLNVSTESRLTLDKYKDPQDDTLQVNFNVDFPALKCEYAKISATNFMGTHMAGIALRVSKVHMDGKGKPLARFEERKEPLKHSENEVHEGPVVTKSLTQQVFTSEVASHEITIVNFCVSGYAWCEMLEPVWEKTSLALSEEKTLGDKYMMAKVNCSDTEANALCKEEGIDTYPTIRVYRKDSSKGASKEAYHGERSVAALSAWASHIIQQGHEKQANYKMVDVDKDGVADSHNGVGCRMSGTLRVQKAPGMIKIQATSDAHAFDWTAMDISHKVTHLSFGTPVSDFQAKIIPPHILGTINALDGQVFTSAKDAPTTHEHMAKVVPYKVVTPHYRWSMQSPEKSTAPPVEGFGYVFHSNNLQKAGEVPELRINYDITPFNVQFSYRQDTLYDFLTQVCAIVGGVFVVSGIVGRILDKFMKGVIGAGATPNEMPY